MGGEEGEVGEGQGEKGGNEMMEDFSFQTKEHGESIAPKYLGTKEIVGAGIHEGTSSLEQGSGYLKDKCNYWNICMFRDRKLRSLKSCWP